jgi:hypothetical protein
MLDFYIVRVPVSNTEETKPASNHFDGVGSLFEGLMAFWVHQNQLLWDRTNTLIAVQAGLLAGSYALRQQPRLAGSIFVAGAFFSLMLYLIILRHIVHRDCNNPLMKQIFTALVSQTLLANSTFTLSVPVSWRAPVKASGILIGSAVFFLFFDLYLAGLFWGMWSPPEFLDLPPGWPSKPSSTYIQLYNG